MASWLPQGGAAATAPTSHHDHAVESRREEKRTREATQRYLLSRSYTTATDCVVGRVGPTTVYAIHEPPISLSPRTPLTEFRLGALAANQ